MLAIGLRRDDPRHLRQGVVLDVALQLLEEGAAVKCTAIEEIGSGARFLEQRAARLSVLILQEVEKRIVAEIADERIVGEAFELRRRETQADVLIDLPRNAGSFELFRIGQ